MLFLILHFCILWLKSTPGNSKYHMSQSAQHLPQTPLPPTCPQQPVQSLRAPYRPAIRQWVQSQNPQPDCREIVAEWHHRCFNIQNDQQDYPSTHSRQFLHPHFCLGVEDCNLAFDEGISDIQDTVSEQKAYLTLQKLIPVC
jgi:hypothetical protein